MPGAYVSGALMLAQARVALLPAAGAGVRAAAADRLQTWVAVRRDDALAWGSLAQLWQQSGQPLRAVRAEAEARAALGDVQGALDRLRAGQRLARTASQGTDFIEASVIESRLRELEARHRQIVAEELG